MDLPILIQLFILFAAAKLAGELCERLGQPAVIGELGVGIVLGPGILHLIDVHRTPFLHELAELAVVILLFRVGLETRLESIRIVGARALTVAVAGVVVPFVLGYGFYVLMGRESITALFIGAALVATSVGVTARVLADMGLLGEEESRIILGAAVIDDILGLIVLSVVASVGSGGGLAIGQVIVTVGLALGFVAFFALAGTKAIRRLGHLLERPRIGHAPFAWAVAICLGVAALAQVIGLAAIIGAFLAGMALAESPDHYELEHAFEPVGEFFVPFFFVITGATVDPSVFLSAPVLTMAAVVVVLAIIGKLVGCGLAARGLGWKSAAIVGVGMVPRGEVGIIVANAGANTGAIDESTFAVIIAMSLLTTLVVPPVLKQLFAGRLAERAAANDRAADGRIAVPVGAR